ncbi:DNA repair protein RadA [Syntrophobotulus glycolicus DSM 8271]|uniref:DNA repair protein RadA n=1 Tax=Syntrophobotulus glycolicus (strain DSM 8271 / FlGlyR) TaxID=645991 RepID=F0SWX4_SYNGF|nr:DNA repair protein RadA [Syntrophobotulus glycolicus]ADY54664.1 DNA repair protein RadA [Syntrophobotulus glycolicus DSM 8271]
MARIKTKYFCKECGQESPRWLGKCPACGEWNTFAEEKISVSSSSLTDRGAVKAAPLSEITSMEIERLDTGNGELNRVLGGGAVPGSFVLVSGEPGIGKSTLLLQLADYLSKENNVLYVSGEESARQIKIRADRLGISSSKLHILTETILHRIREIVLQDNYQVLVIDSIQTMMLEDLESAPGSVSQVREGAAFLMKLAKENHIIIFLVGHITKDGNIAGPRVLEHMVDTVLCFEGDQHYIYRLLRTIKNRFGPANEIGVFEMRGSGLCEVANTSEVFLGSRTSDVAGSAVAVTMEGSRPLLVEIQALVTPTGFNPPRRTVNGMDYHRLLMLLAVLDKRIGNVFYARDVFINIAGGLRIDDPAVDLAIIGAILSAMNDTPLPKLALIGEVGLTGELRGVSQIEQRIKEAEKLGFEGCMIPSVNNQAALKSDCLIYAAGTLEEAKKYLKF